MAAALGLIALLTALGLMLSLAYLGERERGLAWLVYGLFALFDASLVPLGLVFLWAGRSGMLSSADVDEGLATSLFSSEAAATLLSQLGLVALLVGLFGLLLLLGPVRRLVALALPIDGGRVVHAVALQYVVYTIGVSIVTGVTVSLLVGDEQALQDLSDSVAEGGLGPLWAQSAAFVIVAVLGVGIGVKRNVRETLERLGLTRAFSLRWFVAATALGLAASYGVDWIWGYVASDSLAEVERVSEALFAPYLGYGLLGALTIGLSAGVGEEILFRGAAQTRLGLVFTSVLFALVHTQYTVSLALVQILIVGLLLGLTRRHANTTTAIGVHATYNFVLATFAILSSS